MGAKSQRVHQIANRYGVPAGHIIGLLTESGVAARSASSQISAGDLERLVAIHGPELEELGRTGTAHPRDLGREGATPSGTGPFQPETAGPSKELSRTDPDTRPAIGTELHEVPIRRPDGDRTANRESGPKKAKTANSRFTKLAEKHSKRDRAYRAALASEGKQLPNVLGAAEWHGGAQPQVAPRRRGKSVLPNKLAVAPRTKRRKP